jgi:Ca2+/Na+ antiporter
MISPIRVVGDFTLDFSVMLFFSIILLPIIGWKNSISRIEGALLLAFYCMYIGWLATQL